MARGNAGSDVTKVVMLHDDMAAHDQLPQRLRIALANHPFRVGSGGVLEAVLGGDAEDDILERIRRARPPRGIPGTNLVRE